MEYNLYKGYNINKDKVTLIDCTIGTYEDFLRLRPIAPEKSLMVKRSELIQKIVNKENKHIRLRADTCMLEKYRLILNKLEAKILESKV